ncbi:uncharacterized protein [Primulina eburnea]|uniref:uncharacterized protein isoform X1 n=1 Tax=Primulina eburnea TaxID=1245227 RepID=UPI003C6C596E
MWILLYCLVDMVETIMGGDLTAMAEITLVNDTGKMTMGFQSSQREGQIMYTGEFQSMNPDLRNPHGFEKVVILMTMRMRRILRSFLRNFRLLSKGSCSHQYAKGETNCSILQYAGLFQVSSEFFAKNSYKIVSHVKFVRRIDKNINFHFRYGHESNRLTKTFSFLG